MFAIIALIVLYAVSKFTDLGFSNEADGEVQRKGPMPSECR